MSDRDELPSLTERISDWLGFQLPAIPIPLRQTARNTDKALSKLILALSENLEARIKGSTAQAKARAKLAVADLFRTDEEKRKFENRAAAIGVALADIASSNTATDAPIEIEDDWLNFFARLAEDKSSEELQQLFGRILSGEIQRPGSFSLRTLQIVATLSKTDAERLSELFAYVVEVALPFEKAENGRPNDNDRLFLEELGLGSHPSRIGGMQLDVEIQPGDRSLLKASHFGILVQNNMNEPVLFSLPGQALTTSGLDLLQIANPPPTDVNYLKTICRNIYQNLNQKRSDELESKLLNVNLVSTKNISAGVLQWNIIFTQGKD